MAGRRKPRARLAAPLLVAAITFVAASGCGGADMEETGKVSSTEGTGGVSVSKSDSTTAPSPAGKVFFPKHTEATPLVGDGGRLVEDEAGCIRFEISEGDSTTEGATPTVVWPVDWSAKRGDDGGVQILGDEGKVLARVGEKVWVGDGFILPEANLLKELSGVDERTKRELLRRCPGEYYFAGPSIGKNLKEIQERAKRLAEPESRRPVEEYSQDSYR